jgi:dihydrofolate synthase/folylpolyglutamate synthase
MAFDYFERQSVDIAVVEVGLGGRFDSTNVLNPLVSLITNIGYDHTDMLGETLPEIAFEKAGIIKSKVPVVISETQAETLEVFDKKAVEMNAPKFFADQEYTITVDNEKSENLRIESVSKGQNILVATDLKGTYQLKNIPGVMKVVELLSGMGFSISTNNLIDGFGNVVKNTGLLGRWQKLYEKPLTICDTAHNQEGVKLVLEHIAKITYKNLYIIWGAVEGKKLEKVFSLMPNDAFYYFCQASVPRALPAEKLKIAAESLGLHGRVIRDVNEAIATARKAAGEKDLIVIAGSNFIISEIKNLRK